MTAENASLRADGQGVLCSVVHLSAVRWQCKMRNRWQFNSMTSTI